MGGSYRIIIVWDAKCVNRISHVFRIFRIDFASEFEEERYEKKEGQTHPTFLSTLLRDVPQFTVIVYKNSFKNSTTIFLQPS